MIKDYANTERVTGALQVFSSLTPSRLTYVEFEEFRRALSAPRYLAFKAPQRIHFHK